MTTIALSPRPNQLPVGQNTKKLQKSTEGWDFGDAKLKSSLSVWLIRAETKAMKSWYINKTWSGPYVSQILDSNKVVFTHV